MKIYIILKDSVDEFEMIQYKNEFVFVTSNIHETVFYYKREQYIHDDCFIKYIVQIFDTVTDSIIDAEDDSNYNRFYEEYQ